ncbi:MAG: penicillin acylase family protein [Planctomycetota bacterium]|nr:penicillin acylase family protein [Planctomycetota bacterium]
MTSSFFVRSRPRPAFRGLLLGFLVTTGRATAETDPVPGSSFEIPGLQAEVRIELDAQAVPTVEAADVSDAHTALGWLHGRERYFQMDIARRQAAGELAALAGPTLVSSDRANAAARRRATADRILRNFDPGERAVLEAYVRGVNAGLGSRTEPPPEYLLLGVPPTAWTASDSILVLLGMFDMLQDTAEREPAMHALRSRVSPEVAAWMCSVPGRWDTLLIPATGPERTPSSPPGLETRTRGQDDLDRRGRLLARLVEPPELHPGSNSFAVAGSRTPDGRAIVANDPHLQYLSPGIWYRARLRWESENVDATGLSLPGVPGLPIGVTDSLAWGLTNTTGDFEDLVIVEVDSADPSRYRVEGGFESFDDRDVEIEVAGAPLVVQPSRFTRWGPVIGELPDGRPLALLRTSDQPGAVDLGLVGLYTAPDVDTGLAIAAAWGGPSQNVLIADAEGRIGWTLSGYLPNRRGYDGLSPRSHLDGRGWFGPLPETDRPRVVDPIHGHLVTANNRLVPLPIADRLGKVWADGGRAWRIRIGVEAVRPATELDLLSIQLDETVQRFLPYRDLLIRGLRNLAPATPGRDETLAAVETWDGRASAEDTVMPVVEAFRAALLTETRSLLLERFAPTPPEIDEAEIEARADAASAIGTNALLAAIEGGDPRLLPSHEESDHESWSPVLERAAQVAIETRLADPRTPWAERNRSRATHPLGAFQPQATTQLDLPSVPQPGHWSAVRVQSTGFGASARFIASPSDRAKAILTTPGGQSGDPRSPHFTDLHDSWARGEPAALEPGPSVRTLVLVGPAD